MFYLAAIAGPGFTGGTTGYNTISQNGLLASDFVQFDFTTGIFGTAHPNFAGDPLLFGLDQQTNIGFSDLIFEADYDNLNLKINSVPENGGTLVLLLGSTAGLFVLAAFSRTRANA
jgi:hypothetical protein